MRILLGSGTGYIGSRIKSYLCSKGHRVETISRDKNNATYTWADLNNNEIKGSFDAVIDMSGKNIFNGTWAEVVSSRKYACESIVKWIVRQQTPPKIWIGPSAVGIYPCGMDLKWSESDVMCDLKSTPPGKLTKMQQFVVDWEKSQLLPEELNSHVSQVSLRLGVVLGGGSEFMKTIQGVVNKHIAFQIESGTQIVPWIHVDDIAGVVMHCLERCQQSNTAPIHGPYNVVSPMAFSTSYNDILNFMQHYTNKHLVFNSLPSFCQCVIRMCAKPTLQAYLGQELYDLIAKSQKVQPERLLKEKYTFRFSRIEMAIRDSLNTNL